MLSTPEELQRKLNERETPQRHNRFAKVYDRGWDTIASLAGNAMAIKVYTFLAKHCDHLNALVCPVEEMMEEFRCSKSTVLRATIYLEENNHLVIVKVGTANAYVLDPTDLFKNYDQYRGMVQFNATTLASKKQNRGLKRRLTHFMGQGDLFDPETGELSE